MIRLTFTTAERLLAWGLGFGIVAISGIALLVANEQLDPDVAMIAGKGCVLGLAAMVVFLIASAIYGDRP